MNSGFGAGSYTVTDGLGTIIANSSFSSSAKEEFIFETGSFTVGINELSNTETIDNRIFDMFGREHNSYEHLPNGMYFQNGKKFIKIGK